MRLHAAPSSPAAHLRAVCAGLLVAGCVLGTWAAQAGCSRSINTPMALLGQSVIVEGDSLDGIYPDILRSTQSRETCLSTMSAVPRARQELLFESGKADILLPANKTPRRDELGVFVPLTHSRATLLSLQSERAPIRSLKELLEARDLKLALVRGYDYGPAYQALMTELARQGRPQVESDPVTVARRLKSGAVHATVMAPTILACTLAGDERVRGLADKLRYEPMEELPWLGSGLCLSRATLSDADRQALVEFFERIAKSGSVWKGFQQNYEPGVLKYGLKPL